MALVTAGLNRLFQSTLSVRRATDLLVSLGPIPYISIHALRKESDPTVTMQFSESRDFNPRSP